MVVKDPQRSDQSRFLVNGSVNRDDYCSAADLDLPAESEQPCSTIDFCLSMMTPS